MDVVVEWSTVVQRGPDGAPSYLTIDNGLVDERELRNMGFELRDLIGDGKSKVGGTVGFSLGYGNVKASTTVSLSCDQDHGTVEAAIDICHEIATKKSLEALKKAEDALNAAYPPTGG